MKWKGVQEILGNERPRVGKHQTNPRDRRIEPKGLFWDPQCQAQAKFLEAPARYLQPELRKIIAKMAKQSKSLVKALIVAGFKVR